MCKVLYTNTGHLPLIYLNVLGSILWSRRASDSVTLLLLDISRKKRGARLLTDLQALC